MRAAFLGLGAIGRPMAAHLARQHELAVWNRTAARATEFAAVNKARTAVTAVDAVRGAELIVTCLPTSAEVLAVVQEVSAALTAGTLWLDCTSGDPEGARKIAAALSAKSVAFADCPVSGGTNGAEAGTLTVMVGADQATFDRAKPLLGAFAKRIELMGPIGAGSAMKAVNNALLAANILTFSEGFAALVHAGVPARKALEVLNASSGRSFVTESLVPDRVMNGKFPRTFGLALLQKDVGIAVDFLKGEGVDPLVIGQVHRQLAAVRAAMGEDADYLDPVRLQERKSGVEIRG